MHGPEPTRRPDGRCNCAAFATRRLGLPRETAYYDSLFERLEIDPRRLVRDDLLRLPLTRKDALREAPHAFVRRDGDPTFRATTTGTTGKQTSISFSAAEMRTFIALSAISFLAAGHIDPRDIVLLGASSRAALGNSCFAGACARIGALVSIGGWSNPPTRSLS